MSGVKRFRMLAVLLGLACGLWLLGGHEMGWWSSNAREGPGISQTKFVGNPDGAAGLKTKRMLRETNQTHFTHGPQRLGDFLLPDVVLDGENLQQALAKLMTAYQQTCQQTGETPLPLTFVVPAGKERRFHLHLGNRNLNTSIQLLANLSGMKVSRKDFEYQFEALGKTGRRSKDTVDLGRRFGEALDQMSGGRIEISDPSQPDVIFKSSLEEQLSSLGLELDPSTKLNLNGDKLTIESTASPDIAAISALARTLDDDQMVMQKTSSKIIEIPANVDIEDYWGKTMTDNDVQVFMRYLANQDGVRLNTMPALVSPFGQPATIEMVRELSGQNFEPVVIGQVGHFTGRGLGFGQQVDLSFTGTTGGIDPTTGKPVIDERTNIQGAEYVPDGSSRMMVQTRADGTKTLIMVSSQRIDAYGRLLSESLGREFRLIDSSDE